MHAAFMEDGGRSQTVLDRIAGFGRNGMRIAFVVIIKEVAIVAGRGNGKVFQPDNVGILIVLGIGFNDSHIPAFALFRTVSAGFDFAADFDDIVGITVVIQLGGNAVNGIAFGQG